MEDDEYTDYIAVSEAENDIVFVLFLRSPKSRTELRRIDEPLALHTRARVFAILNKNPSKTYKLLFNLLPMESTLRQPPRVRAMTVYEEIFAHDQVTQVAILHKKNVVIKHAIRHFLALSNSKDKIELFSNFDESVAWLTASQK